MLGENPENLGYMLGTAVEIFNVPGKVFQALKPLGTYANHR
jgi:hypothetical protein